MHRSWPYRNAQLVSLHIDTSSIAFTSDARPNTAAHFSLPRLQPRNQMAGQPKDRRQNVVRNASTRPKGTYIILIVVAVVGASLLAYAATRKPQASTATAPEPIKVDLATAGPPQGYLIGKADAPVKIMEFADFECPACGRFATITEPDVRKRIIDAGLANLTYYDF